MKRLRNLVCALAVCGLTASASAQDTLSLFTADNPFFQYTGRIDFSRPKLPRYWQPGVYITAKFSGTQCRVLLNDQMLSPTTHNYIELAVDDQPPVRLHLTGRTNEIDTLKGLSAGSHTLVICKNT